MIKVHLIFLIILIIFLFILFIFIFFLKKQDYYTSINNKPKIYNLNISLLKKYNFDYFIKNYGDMEVLITYSKPNSIDMLSNFKRVTIKKYCLDIMKNNPEWYFKTEDEYDFLALLDIKNPIIEIFDKLFNKYENIIFKNTSFWMGGKNSTTGWHTDMDDLSYLYVIKGKKKISLISPKYDNCMYIHNMYTKGSKWSCINFKNIDYNKFPKFKNVKINTYILNEGDCIYIPRNWWHCVENLEDSIGITYKLYRTKECIASNILEKIREIYYIIKMKKINTRDKMFEKLVTKEEYQHYNKKIIENNKKLMLKHNS